MCCLFGLIDCRGSLGVREKNRMLAILASACEARGIDATGIAYNAGGKLRIYKRPQPAHLLHFHIPGEARAIMGHTRMTTQGSEQKNCNNHPFPGRTREGSFALAHNGVLHNDKTLRRSLCLPGTSIETDSYIAVQLLEREGALHFDTLRHVAETIEGSFCLSILDSRDNLYLVKGDNPLCLYHFPGRGLYLYASTESILLQALAGMGLSSRRGRKIPLSCGEILRISPAGEIARECFDDSRLFSGHWRSPWVTRPYDVPQAPPPVGRDPYLEELKSVARSFGYTPESIDRLLAMGFYPEEVEEFLYEGEI